MSTAEKTSPPPADPQREPGLVSTLSDAEPGSRRGISVVPTIRWYESWIFKAAIMASFILFVGYAVSAFFAFESIDWIANLAHDQEIEESLSTHLESIKRIHQLQQQLIVERLKPDVARYIAQSKQQYLDEATIRKWLDDADLAGMTEVKDVKLTSLKGKIDQEDLDQPLKWLDRDRLKLLDWVLEFPKGATYESFKAAEDVKQRYQLIGAKLQDYIRPMLVKAAASIPTLSFILLASLFFFYARRFKAKIGEVTSGFQLWSERDAQFRFDELYTGELKLITMQFNNMADEVETNRQRSLYLEKIASWQIIARKLAHEIKNPLTPIQMMVSQLKRRYKGDDPAFAKLLDDAQHIITEEVSGLRRMVDNFSNFARLPEPQPRDTDLVQVCRHAMELQKAVCHQHEIGFETRLSRATALADDDLMRQVLINLIKNAAEACGDKPSKILVGLEEAGPDLVITVKDNGPGIPPELKDRIFEAYFTTKHTGPNPGMGLGLAVCQKIVIDHGGKMSVRSKPGETVFMIRLPRKKKD